MNPPAQQTNKHVLVYNTDVVANPLSLTTLQQDTTIRLAQNTVTRHLMITFEDIYRVGMLNTQDALIGDFVPVQIGPISIAMAPDKSRVYVLNYWSSTISAIRPDMFAAGKPIPLGPLVTYRAGVLNAYVDLFGGLLQYLKDCFCDHLLVDCPTCDERDTIELACISIKNNKVFKVCNFSHRKYVHTFPTWEYWLSIIPVLPLLKQAVEKVCCAALPGLFARYNAPTPQPPANTTTAPSNTLNSGPFRKSTTTLRQTDIKGAFLEQMAKFTVGSKVATDAITSAPSVAPATTPSVTTTDISGVPVADAKVKLGAAKINVVREEEYDPTKGGQTLGRFVTSPARLREGDRVTLVTKEGKVLFYAREPEPSAEIAVLRTELQATRADLNQARPQLADLQAKLDASTSEGLQLRQQINRLEADVLGARKTHDTELQARDAKIAELETTMQTFRTSVQATTDLQARLERLERRPPG